MSTPKVEDTTEVVTKINIPSFCQSSPATWFVLVESTFAINRILRDSLKYHFVLTLLPEEIVLSIIDLINEPPEDNKYDTLKHTILARHTDSETKRLTRLLDGIAIVDDKPSQYYRRLELTAGTSKFLSKYLLKQMWLNWIYPVSKGYIGKK